MFLLLTIPALALGALVLQAATDPFSLPASWGVFLAAVAAALPVANVWVTTLLKRVGWAHEFDGAILARWAAVLVWLGAVVVGPVDLPGEFVPAPATVDPLLILGWLAAMGATALAQIGFIAEGSRWVYDRFFRGSGGLTATA